MYIYIEREREIDVCIYIYIYIYIYICLFGSPWSRHTAARSAAAPAPSECPQSSTLTN